LDGASSKWWFSQLKMAESWLPDRVPDTSSLNAALPVGETRSSQFMSSKMIFFLLLILPLPIELRTEPREYRVKHDHALGSCQGTLTFADQEIHYEATDGKHAYAWPYIEIQKLDVVSPTQVTLKTFKSASWEKWGKDQTFQFTLLEGKLTATNQEFLRSKLSRPMVARLTETHQSSTPALPVRHRHRLGGCEGHLRIDEDRLIYSTDRSSDNRVWKLSDIETIGSADPYHLRVTSYDETFIFDLKSPLDSKVYDSLWKKIHRLDNVQASLCQSSE
jgi:hypothetical protein